MTRSARADARARDRARAEVQRRERIAIVSLAGLAVLAGGTMLLALGCRGGSGSIAVPSFSTSTVAAAAVAQYDANKDGALDAKELEQCPGLLEAFNRGLDKDKDGRVTAGEIDERLRIYREEGMMTTCVVNVLLDGNPLAGATVTLTPEKFLGSSHKPATATTGPDGFSPLAVEGLQPGFVLYGFYRIEVSKKGGGGSETIPARYNAQTTLGKEIAPARAQDRRGQTDDTIVLRLTSK